MAGYDLTIRTKRIFHDDIISFLKFLQNVGKRLKVSFKYRTIRKGSFEIIIDGTPGAKIDAFFQEIILNKGLYYYSCSLTTNNRRKIISNVIVPVYQILLNSRFQYPHSKSVTKHVLGKFSQNKDIPGDFKDQFAHDYEILFRKWDLNIINDWDFIKDTDSLLTKFLLTAIKHTSGQKSPKFPQLLEKAYKQGLGMDKTTKKSFYEIHNVRTAGLHRLVGINTQDISKTAIQMYLYYEYFDEFIESQKEKKEKLHGKWYSRIKYGDENILDENGEPYKDENGNPYDYEVITQTPCHDCAAIKGQFHCSGCDVEQCARCKGQRLGCECKLDKDFD